MLFVSELMALNFNINNRTQGGFFTPEQNAMPMHEQMPMQGDMPQ